MTRSRPCEPAPPTAEESEAARAAAAALRLAIADPSTMGAAAIVHVDLCRPRRGEWLTTWPGLPGFLRTSRQDGTVYAHACLPGWEYTRQEIKAEMIPDLDALAERGERPAQATGQGRPGSGRSFPEAMSASGSPRLPRPHP